MPKLRRRLLTAPVFAVALALALALALSASLAAAPRWTALGPYGGLVDRLTVDPADARVLYARADAAGVFKSADAGASWSLIQPGLYFSGVAVDPSRHTTIYQTNLLGFLWKSLDGGAHWTQSALPFFARGGGEVTVDPAKPARLYLATFNGVWRSSDGGATWSPGLHPLTNQFVWAVVALPRPAGTVFAATQSGLVKSVDAGDSWKPVTKGLPAGAVTALARATVAGTLWANVEPAGIFRSTDNGASWRPTASLGVSTQRGVLAADPNSAKKAWIGTVSKGAFRTTDAGTHWTAVGPRPNTTFQALAFGGSTLYAGVIPTGVNIGVLASPNGGAAWQPRNRGLTALEVKDLAIDPGDPRILWAAAAGAGLFRSLDGGLSWALPPQPSSPAPDDFLTLDTARFAADGSALYTTIEDKLWKTVNQGASWRAGGDGPPPFFVVDPVPDPRGAATIYSLGGPSRLNVSQDAGETWQNLALPFTCEVSRIVVSSSVPTTLYVAGVDEPCSSAPSTLHRSTDGGAHWTRADQGVTWRLESLAVDPADPQLLYAGSDQGSWRSTDGGGTWTAFDTGLRSQSSIILVLAVSPVDGTVWAALGSQVAVSRDGGVTWKPAGGPPVIEIDRLFPDLTNPNRLFAATTGGVWVLDDVAP